MPIRPVIGIKFSIIYDFWKICCCCPLRWKVGNMKYIWIIQILAHSPVCVPRSSMAADARLICAARPFVGGAVRISLTP